MNAPGTGLAVIGGSGALPGLVLAACPQAHLVRFEGAGCDTHWTRVIDARFERMGALFKAMRKAGVSDVCLAGAMARPRLNPALLDLVTMAAAPRIMAMMKGGDDGLLRAVIALFEDNGFRVRGVHELVPDLLAGPDPLCGTPSAAQSDDAARGCAILNALGPVDVGQACVVAGGLCFGVESIQGTDALLTFVAQTRGGLKPTSGGVLIKRAKPGQDLRVDMPTIGPATIDAAQDAGLDGIALQAGHVLVVERDKVLHRAGAAGLALWTLP